MCWPACVRHHDVMSVGRTERSLVEGGHALYAAYLAKICTTQVEKGRRLTPSEVCLITAEFYAGHYQERVDELQRRGIAYPS
jgi:hypothetical protein